jgi:hypothetical protein
MPIDFLTDEQVRRYSRFSADPNFRPYLDTFTSTTGIARRSQSGGAATIGWATRFSYVCRKIAAGSKRMTGSSFAASLRIDGTDSAMTI